jgi:hypothetical protein
MALRRPQRIGPVVAPERFAVGQNRGVCLIGRASRRLLDRFGFSWTIAVLPCTARKQGLDFLGFPWILSSESRFFNGLRGIFREENFSRPFAARQRAGTGAGILTMQKRSIAHRASLTRFLLFCNQLPATKIVDSLSSRRRGVSDFTQSSTRRKIVELGIE